MATPSLDPTFDLVSSAQAEETRSKLAMPAVARHALRAFVVCCCVLVVTFLLVRVVPGDPVAAITGPHAPKQARTALRAELHLNGSLLTQFGGYISDLAHGNLGTSVSVQQGTSVNSIIGQTLPVTLYVVAGTILLSVFVGVPLGIIAARRPGSADLTVRTMLTILLAVPPFFLGLVLILVVSLDLGLLPAGGWGAGWPGRLRFLILPCIALAAYLMPIVARTTRQAVKDALAEPWAEAAIARGLSERRVTMRHLLPNSVLPVITLLGYNAGALIAGAVVVEAVFGLPGIGQTLVNAVSLRDYPLIQGIAIVCALAVVLANLAADLLYHVADPRTRRG